MPKAAKLLLTFLAVSALLLTSCAGPLHFSATAYGKVSAYFGDVTKSMNSPTVLSFTEKVAPKIAENQYVVRLDATRFSLDIQRELETFGKVLDELRVENEVYFLLETEIDISRLQQDLSKLRGFLGVEPNRVLSVSSIVQPNDRYFPEQWNLQLINVPSAWNMTTGTDVVIVAVIDTGVDFSHEDLVGIFVPGYDFVNNDPYPQDDNGHGTHVTGIIAAITNNSRGVAGVAWGQNVKIMPLKTLDMEGVGHSFNVAKAIVYAVDHGAKVINASFGSEIDSFILYDAVKYAYQNDVVIVCAAGNDGDYGIDYPAAYPETIAVGAVNADSERASYSDYGPELDVVAPGGNETNGVLSTWLNNNYVYAAGTSMAAPHVTAIVALMISQGIVGVENIRSVLRRTATDLGPQGWDNYYGAGLVDAYNAVKLQEGWEPLIVFSVDDKNNLDNQTVADGLGRFQLEVHKPVVKIFAWVDFDHDEEISGGDLLGYVGYSGGDPTKGTPSLLTFEMYQEREINFYIAPIVDTSDRPILSVQDMKTLSNYKKSIVAKHYHELKAQR